jgi:hypothetical protein
LNPPGLNSARLPSHASIAFPEIMVCDSLAVCQCFRTWIAFEVRMSRLVVCVVGSTRRKQISGEFSPRSGIILSYFRSDTFLKNRPIARRRRRLGCLRTKAGQRQQCQRRRTERSNLVFMIGSIDLTFQFHKKSYAAVALIRVRGPGIIDPGYSESMNQIDESVRETE